MIRFVEETRVRVYRSHVDYAYMLVIGTHVPMIMWRFRSLSIA